MPVLWGKCAFTTNFVDRQRKGNTNISGQQRRKQQCCKGTLMTGQDNPKPQLLILMTCSCLVC